MIDTGFFAHCALVSVDLQEGAKGVPVTGDALPPDWKEMGFAADDVNAATDFAWDVALPNAARVVACCRRASLPLIFLHWGYRFADGMDLDPVIRAAMLRNHGGDFSKWHGHIDQPGSQPAVLLDVQPGDYVIAKTAQDAFISSSLDFVLANLGVRHVIFMGGHTEACLGKTATSAKRRGYRTLCVSDATTNARESTRAKGIREAQFDGVVTTDELIALLDQAFPGRLS